MSQNRKPAGSGPPATDWPSYWFVRLERAVEENDFEAAAEAQRNLRRLGVEVRFGKREELAHAS